MCNPLWLTAVCHEWPANMRSGKFHFLIRAHVALIQASPN